MNDPFGTVLLAIRADDIVASIVGDTSLKVTSRAAQPPSVRLRNQGTSLTPFGTNSNTVGVQLATYIAQCYGLDDDPNGEMVASQLARAVSDVMHGLGARRGSGSNLIIRSWTPDISEVLRDPDTDWPYHTVRIEAFAST